MATVLPAFNPIAGIPEAIQAFRQRHIQGQQQGIQQQALQQAAGQFGLNLPQGINPQLANLLINNAQQASLTAPTPLSPSQGISQAKLNRINILQSRVDDGTATEKEFGILEKMLGGVSPVQVNIGKSTGGERTALAETESSLNAIDNLEQLFNKKTTRTGPVVGRIDPALGLVGKTTQEQEEFMAATTAFTNRVIKDITGAQMSEPEAKRIKAQIPLVTDPPARWRAKFNQTKRNLKVLQEKREQVLIGSGIPSPLGDGPSRANLLQPATQQIRTPQQETRMQELLRKAGQ